MTERICGAVELHSCINIVQIRSQTSSILYYVKTGVETDRTAHRRFSFIFHTVFGHIFANDSFVDF